MMIHFTLALLTAGLFPVLAAAQEVGLAGIMGSKAMLMVNGGEPQAEAIGQSLGRLMDPGSGHE